MQSISDTSSRNASESVAPTSLQSERRVRSSEAFCRFTFEQSQCSKTQSMNAARSSAMPLMRQPVNGSFETSAGEIALRQREVFQTGRIQRRFLFGGLRKQRREISARSIAVVACCVSYPPEYGHTATRVQQKTTQEEEHMLKKPNTGESLCSFVEQYVIMVFEVTYEHHDVTKFGALLVGRIPEAGKV